MTGIKEKNISGLRFNNLTAIKSCGRKMSGGKMRPFWSFRCDCGNEIITRKISVVSGETKSCGCLRIKNLPRGAKNINDINGKKFGKLTAIHYIKSVNSKQIWLFKCDCGNEIENYKDRVVCGITTTCGCYKRSKEYHSIKHGMSYTRFYNIYCGMLERCNNPRTESFYRYGGRGILVLWKSFDDFKRDMYEPYLEHIKKHGKNTTIERINNDGNYCKENCKWATYHEQMLNTSRSRKNKPSFSTQQAQTMVKVS